MLDILKDALLDSVKLIPFLFITYLALGFLEHATSDRAQTAIQKAGKFGPIWGSLIGAVPQCGFSAAASYFYVGKVITLGTLISIYLSTSDEMLPILLTANMPLKSIASIMIWKIIIGMISGFVVELFFGWLARRRPVPEDFDSEVAVDCGCATHIIVEAVQKTLKVVFFIFIVSLAIGAIVEFVGHDAISSIFHGIPVIGELLAGLVGLVPNCAASVVITQLYVEGVIGSGPLMAGLLSSAGVGLLVLFGENRHAKQNLMVLGILYAVSVAWGIFFEVFGITF